VRGWGSVHSWFGVVVGVVVCCFFDFFGGGAVQLVKLLGLGCGLVRTFVDLGFLWDVYWFRFGLFLLFFLLFYCCLCGFFDLDCSVI